MRGGQPQGGQFLFEVFGFFHRLFEVCYFHLCVFFSEFNDMICYCMYSFEVDK